MTDRKGDWMQTYTGKMFWPVDPRAEEVDIDDIAHALSMLCRYGGHVKKFYSVAEHSCHIFDMADRNNKMWALLHDASEAYITDIIRPLKPYLSDYKGYESAVMKVICEKFNLPITPPDEIKRLDNKILADELYQAMTAPPRDWDIPDGRLGVSLQFWSPERAEKEFLDRFYAVAHNSLGSITRPAPPPPEPEEGLAEPRIVRGRRASTPPPSYVSSVVMAEDSSDAITRSRLTRHPDRVNLTVTASGSGVSGSFLDSPATIANFGRSQAISSTIRAVTGNSSTRSTSSTNNLVDWSVLDRLEVDTEE